MTGVHEACQQGTSTLTNNVPFGIRCYSLIGTKTTPKLVKLVFYILFTCKNVLFKLMLTQLRDVYIYIQKCIYKISVKLHRIKFVKHPTCLSYIYLSKYPFSYLYTRCFIFSKLECKIQKNWCTVTAAPTTEHHGGHSRTPANQRWDQAPGRSQRPPPGQPHPPWMPATQRKCTQGGPTLDVVGHYIGSVTATTHQEKGIITLESNPLQDALTCQSLNDWKYISKYWWLATSILINEHW